MEGQQVISAPRIELATRADVASLAGMRHAQGWSRSADLLEALLSWPGGRVFVIRERDLTGAEGAEGARIAVATVASVAPPVGVIGSVITRPEFQRRGLGRLIMAHALDWLARAGAHTVSLDATLAGRPLYRGLGFVEGASSWYARTPLVGLDRGALSALAGATPPEVVAAGAEVLPTIAGLDRAGHGGDRLGLLERLLRMDGHGLLIAAGADGAPTGYLMTRPPEPPLTGTRVGPLIARDDASAAALLAAAYDRASFTPNAALTASIAGDNPDALALFATFGATPVEDDLIMRVDLPGAPDEASAARDDGATQARAYCWLAPMVF